MNDVGRVLGATGTAHISSLTASPDGRLVVGCLWAGGARMFDATTLEPLPFQDHTPECASVAFSPRGDQVAVADSSYGHLTLYDVSSGAPSPRQPGGFPASWGVLYTPWNHVDVTFSLDGNRLAAQLHRFLPVGEFARHGRVMVWDTAEPSEPVFSVLLPQFSHLALSPSGDRLFAATRTDRTLRVYDVGSGRSEVGEGPLHRGPGRERDGPEPDGSALAVATGDRVIRFDARTLRRRGVVLTGHTAQVLAVAYSHNGRLLATSF